MPSMPWIFRPSLCSVTKKRGSFVLLMTRRGQYCVDFLKSKRTKKPTFSPFRYFKTKVVYSGIDLPMKVPIGMYPDEVGDVWIHCYCRCQRISWLFFIFSFFFFILSFSGRNQFSLITLINKFGTFSLNRENGVMILFNGLTFDFLISFYFVFPFAWLAFLSFFFFFAIALLKQQRIIFLGYNHPAGEVANYVLAACSMASPPLRGFVQRAFPYTNLVNVDNMLSWSADFSSFLFMFPFFCFDICFYW